MNKLVPSFVAEANVTSTAFLIAGMHRSGTSALARVLALLGAQLPQTLMSPGSDNPKGFWESALIAQANDEILSELGSSWDDVLAFLLRRKELKNHAAALRRVRHVIASEFGRDAASAIVLKEPRTALLLDLWLGALSAEGFSPRVVIPVRNPLEIGASLAARNGFAIGHSLMLWLAYFLAAERSSRGAPRAFVHFPDLLQDWRGVIRRLERELDFSLAGWTPIAELEIDAYLSHQDRHQVVASDLLTAREDVADWVKRAYRWGLEAASGKDVPDPAELDVIGAEFEAAMRVFAPLIAEQRVAINSGADAIAALQAEARDREDSISRLCGEVESLGQSVNRQLGENQTLQASLEEIQQEMIQRDGAIAMLQDNVASLECKLADQAAELQREQLAREHDAALISRREADAAALQREVAGLRISKSRQAAHVEELEASVRAATQRASAESGERRGLEIVADAQRTFIERSVPFARRLRRWMWRTSLLRHFSYAAEFAGLSVRRGPAAAMKVVLAAARLRSSGAFDEGYYLDRAWDVRALGQDPIIHYVVAGAAEGRDPSPSFSTVAYCRRYPDVLRERANPLFHFIRHGRKEGRIAVASAEAAAGEKQAAEDAGRRDTIDLYANRPDDAVAPEAERGRAFMDRFRLLSDASDWAGAVAALNTTAEPATATPAVSVIVPVYGQLAYTLNCLDALLAHRSKHTFEVIVVDDCSQDASRDWLGRVRGVRMHARRANGGFIAACNDGAVQARGQWLVFLNNDTRVVAGWLDALIDSFSCLPDAELVGSKLFYPDGSLQEAGGLIWRDGSAWNYGRNDDSGRPEYCYARPVDYVSGASIAIARAVWDEIGGFDARYAPAYGEDSDLALKIRYGRGRQVWMQPLSRVIHYEGQTSGVDVTRGVKACQVRNAQTLFDVWKETLSAHRPNGDMPQLEKDRGVVTRALVIDATTPQTDKDAGSVTCLELMRALQSADYKVTFAAEDNLLYLPDATARLQAMGIEAVYCPYVASIQEFLQSRGHEFDFVLIFRYAIAAKHLPAVRAHCPGAKVVLHNSDLHFLREERHADLTKDPRIAALAAETRARELEVISSVDATIVHSTFEVDVLAQLLPDAKVFLFPWILDPAGRTAPFAARCDIAFLGGYRHTPNVDAVKYFAERIWPLIHAERPDIRFIVAGSECPDEILQLNGRNNIAVVGYVDDLKDFFGRIRLTVAPIRYGAGMKGKVAMSLAHGVPTVVTSCAAEGMLLMDENCVLLRDEEHAFAQAVIALYDDEKRWTRMSDNALAFVENTYGTRLARQRIEQAIALANGA